MPEPCSPLGRGDVIHGFAYGAFGRDHYDCVRIESVGPDWIVTRSTEGEPDFASGRRSLELCQRARDEECSNARTQRLNGDADARCSLAHASPPLTTWKAT